MGKVCGGKNHVKNHIWVDYVKQEGFCKDWDPCTHDILPETQYNSHSWLDVRKCNA